MEAGSVWHVKGTRRSGWQRGHRGESRRWRGNGDRQMVEGMAGILGSLGSTLNERGSHWMGFEQVSNTETEQVERG